jgi:hypothetical protein
MRGLGPSVFRSDKRAAHAKLFCDFSNDRIPYSASNSLMMKATALASPEAASIKRSTGSGIA